MFPRTGSGLSFLKILGGISRSLRIAQEIIPIYEQAKPMIQNVRKVVSSFKNINTQTNTNEPPKIETKTNEQLSNKKTITQSNSSINNPQFFK